MGARILVVGAGAREHALADKLARGESGTRDLDRDVIVLGANAGIAREFECVLATRPGVMGAVELAQRIAPDLVVVGPEAYLAEGLVDALHMHGICAFGPSKKATMIEASKSFMKEVCREAQVRTADFKKISTLDQAKAHLNLLKCERIVLKADGLCGGKGALVCASKGEAAHHVERLFTNKGFEELGLQNKHLIIEEFLDGSEVSVFGVANGSEVALFCPMQDHKRLLDGDEGPNTGGMGAVGPLGFDGVIRKKFLEQVKKDIFLPVLKKMSERGAPFSGLLYAGLMQTKDGIQVLEFNARFGDPETQALLFGTKADIYPLLSAVAHNDTIDFEHWQSKLLRMDAAAAVVLAGDGYPRKVSQPQEIVMPNDLPSHARIYFGSSAIDNQGNLLAGSGRAISVVAKGKSVEKALTRVYELVPRIRFSGSQYRSDIGSKLSLLQMTNKN